MYQSFISFLTRLFKKNSIEISSEKEQVFALCIQCLTDLGVEPNIIQAFQAEHSHLDDNASLDEQAFLMLDILDHHNVLLTYKKIAEYDSYLPSVDNWLKSNQLEPLSLEAQLQITLQQRAYKQTFEPEGTMMLGILLKYIERHACASVPHKIMKLFADDGGKYIDLGFILLNVSVNEQSFERQLPFGLMLKRPEILSVEIPDFIALREANRPPLDMVAELKNLNEIAATFSQNNAQVISTFNEATKGADITESDLESLEHELWDSLLEVGYIQNLDWRSGSDELFYAFDALHQAYKIPVLTEDEKQHYDQILEEMIDDPKLICKTAVDGLMPLLTKRSEAMGLYLLSPSYLWDAIYFTLVPKSIFEKWNNHVLPSGHALISIDLIQ